MRITTWNCAGGLSKKIGRLSDLASDVVVLQECSRRDAEGIGALFLGPGDPQAKKGVAIQAFNPSFEVVPSPQLTRDYWWLLPAEVHGPERFNVLAVWAYGHRRQPSGLRLDEVLDRWEPFIASAPTVVLGDFNNSVFWDTPRHPYHRLTTEALESSGLTSAYHEFHGVAQGQEKDATLMWQYNPAKPYHIDYVFVPACWRNLITGVEVGEPDLWLPASDHMPVTISIRHDAEHRRR